MNFPFEFATIYINWKCVGYCVTATGVHVLFFHWKTHANASPSGKCLKRWPIPTHLWTFLCSQLAAVSLMFSDFKKANTNGKWMMYNNINAWSCGKCCKHWPQNDIQFHPPHNLKPSGEDTTTNLDLHVDPRVYANGHFESEQCVFAPCRETWYKPWTRMHVLKTHVEETFPHSNEKRTEDPPSP